MTNDCSNKAKNISVWVCIFYKNIFMSPKWRGKNKAASLIIFFLLSLSCNGILIYFLSSTLNGKQKCMATNYETRVLWNLAKLIYVFSITQTISNKIQ